MKSHWKRLLSGSLALVLAGSLALPALAEDAPAQEVPAAVDEELAQPLSVTVGTYIPGMAGSENIQAGETYTLIALPSTLARSGGDGNEATLSPAELLAANGQALFIGSAVAEAKGRVVFEDVRLRTAEAVVYYVTGPGLAAPLYEATSSSTMANGRILTDTPTDHSATVALVDAVTGYRYGDAVRADEDGNYFFDTLAPGTYNLLVSKPGYLPTTRTAVTIDDQKTTIINLFNLSSEPYTPVGQSPIAGLSRVGDVTGDGQRDMADLAALLLYYDRAGEVPTGMTADLNGDGEVDHADVTLLLTAAAKPNPKDITTGTATNVTGARVTVSDSGAAATATSRYLSIGLESSATVSAAALTLSFPLDAVQPLNAKGGLIAPTDGATVANCLVPASGVEARLVRWSVFGNTATLSFALTCDTPKAAGELAKFYYRPVSGTTADFYDGVFTLDHAAALTGLDTVVTDLSLTYPGQSSAVITSITIDQSPTTLTIPATGRTAVLPLSATGSDAQTSYPDLTGLIWTAADENGDPIPGVSVERGLLTVTDLATPGPVYITASRDSVTSAPVIIILEGAPLTAYAIAIQKDGQPCDSDALGVLSGDAAQFSYEALVTDQYSQPLATQPQVTWLLSGAPVGVSVSEGVLDLDGTTPAGSYSLRLLAQSGSLQAAVDLSLTVEPKLAQLLLSGSQSAVIPSPGDDPLSLTYTLTALDAQGVPMALADLDPVLTIAPSDQGVDAARNPLSGAYEVTVSTAAQAGAYTLTAQAGEITGTLSLTLLAAENQQAVRAAMYLDGEALSSAQFSFPAGTAQTLTFTAQLLDAGGVFADDQPQSWSWSLSPAPSGLTLPATGAQGRLSLSATLPAGSYTFDLIATDSGTGLSVTLPVTLTLTPVLGSLSLTAPESLPIPDQGSLTYTLSATALDAQGAPMALPEDLVWTVADQGGKAPAWASVDQGILTLSPAAVPGALTVTVSDPAGAISDSAAITLTPATAGQTQTLVLYRSITVDGKTEEESAPVSAPDALNVKEGQRVVITYSPMLVDPSTGDLTAAPAAQVKWLGGTGSFVIDENAESGVYSTNPTAVYAGQSVSASAAITVYPNITGLLLDFGDGQDQPPYELAVPSRGSSLYSATVLAQIVRAGEAQTLPIAQLGLSDYDIEVATALTGLYAQLDKPSGVLTFTVDPAAIQNPTSAPTDGTSDIRYVQLYLDYFPDETLRSNRLALTLTPETAVPTSAILRRGTGYGSSFSFGTPKPDEITTAAAGTLSNCYALELLDQYGSQITGKTVEWSLTVSDELVSGSRRLVTLADPGSAIGGAYPSYVSIRRLRIASDAPAGGPYPLTLTAQCGDLTCSIPIQLMVEPPVTETGDLSMTLSGPGQVIIPMYYAQYNSSTINNRSNTASYTAILLTPSGSELDLMAGYSLSWSVTDPSGKTPTGVSVASNGTGSASATVSVSNAARPTGIDDSSKHHITAILRDSQGRELISASSLLELNRGAAVPTLMSVRRSSSATFLTSDSFTMALNATDPITQDYTFHLLDQYNDQATLRFRRQVAWTLTPSNSGITLQTLKDSDGVPYARLTMSNPGKNTTIKATLAASITIAEESAPSGLQTIERKLPITLTVGSGSSGGGNSGGSLGGDLGTSGGTPDSIVINGNATLNATQGTAASQTYSCVLRDANRNTCSTSDHNKVTWSATGLSGGLSFNSSTRTLTVPATATVGTYRVTITATYSSRVKTSKTVTVIVSAANSGVPTSIAINGNGVVNTTQGTAVTRAWSATLRDAQSTIVTNPSGTVTWSLSPLTNGSVTVSFDPKTATLTVPANAGAGTLNATLTATYGTLKATLPVTVTVTQNATTPAAPTIVPTFTASGTAGSVTLTAAQEKAITDSTVQNGLITVAPTGPTNLTSATLTLTAATAKAMSGSKNQSLKLQTALGSVTLSAQALAALANQGGSDVSITLSSDHGVIKVTFTCGYEASSLPGSIALTAPTTGNVAIQALPGGSKQVVKKAVVKNGSIATYLTGAAQLELETRVPSFADTQSHWAKDAITFTAARELFQGTSATTFSPNDAMTRSMVVTVLHRLEDTPAPTTAAAFGDVPGNTWYTDAVAWASGKGIVNGTGNGFQPGDPVTREQLAKILYEYVRSLGLSTAQTNSLSSFSDQGRVSSWARDAMEWAVGAGLINGKSDGRLDPTGNASRAEVSTILQRLITNLLTPAA